MTETLTILNNIFLAAAVLTAAAALVNYGISLYNDRLIAKAPRSKRSKVKTLRCFRSGDFVLGDRVYYIILGLIVVLGVGIRVYMFGSVPGGFNQDGAMAAVDGKALADYATDRFGTFMPAHLYAWGYGQMSSLLSYMIAIFVKFFGLNEITARLPQLIMSLAGGVFLYLLMRDLFGKGAGLIAAFFVALNPWHLVQSRWALDCNLLPHFFIGGLYFLNKGLSKRRRYLYISMIFFALCMYCYGITIYTIPVFLVAVCVYYTIRKRMKPIDILICAGVYLAIAWPFILTMAVNYFKWDTIELPFVTIQYYPGSVRSSDILLFSDEPMKQLGLNLKSLLNTTLLQKKDLPWNDIEGFGTMFFCTMPFVFVGFVELLRSKTEGAKGLVLFALLAGLWVGVLTNGVNINRINLVYYGIMMFAVLGIYFTIKEIKYFKWSNLCIYGVLGVLLISAYFGTYADSIKSQFYYGFGDALDTAEASGAEKLYITADAQGEGYAHVSEILTMFYDETDAEYFQGKTDSQHGESLLPYEERFNYVSFTRSSVRETENEDAAYVILKSDKQYFNASRYNFADYGNFCAVTQK
ncbi:MAG TPA: glycosyltransferase family 39 protein [Candidatus Monoglobus merdigallinarum]|uniref:Glycosyltransferase family 39 protein n=1 Tax=Candidatus Monoglobus merdigallinarum TaxID=2838698 RepID=A0A9D1PSC3_9FIRM|nr:glycosyltransferase family 39 protein [Candidatus Monoglobus merdigallinarum]